MKKIWTWFTGLKRGWQIVIVIALGILVLSAAADDQQPTAKPTETTAEKSGPPTPTMVPPSTATTERPSPLKKPTLTIMQRCTSATSSSATTAARRSASSTPLGERKKKRQARRASLLRHQHAGPLRRLRVLLRRQARHEHDAQAEAILRENSWLALEQAEARAAAHDGGQLRLYAAGALAATAMLSGRPILAAQAMKLAIEGGC